MTYEYVLPFIHESNLKKFYLWKFEHSEWSICNQTCGLGYKTLEPKCFENRLNTKVDDSLCDLEQKPFNIVEKCNKHSCKPEYK